MRILLDTHILLWAAAGDLPGKAAPYIENRANALYFSPASIWEIIIKNGLGRADFNVDVTSLYSGLLRAGYEELLISARHALQVETLPALHKDPYDRILLAQAISESISLMTADKVLKRYPGPVIYVG